MAVENTNVDHDLDYLWLPSEFLTDDDILTDFKFANVLGSSPVESHDDEDDDDLFTEISRYACSDEQLGWKLPGSSQATLTCKGTANSIIISKDCPPAFDATTSLFPPLPPNPKPSQKSRRAFQYQTQAQSNGGGFWQQGFRIEYQLGSGRRSLQQQPMALRATKERKGTGVFMPRRFDSDSRDL